MDLLEKLQVCADLAVKVVPLLHSGDQGAQQLARAVIENLQVYRGVEIEPEIAEHRGKLAQLRAETAKRRIQQIGPKLWADLHTRALSPVTDETAEAAWLAGWRKQLPCGECLAHYDAFVKEHQPVYTNYFVWSVELHNFINSKLNAPKMKVTEARRHWEAVAKAEIPAVTTG